MFLIQKPEFSIREFYLSDFERLFSIANSINEQAKNKDGFLSFYAFQVDTSLKDYKILLQQRIRDFLLKSQDERSVKPRKTYRMALCDEKGELIGNITIDNLPSYDNEGKKIQGDVGYFINPDDGRKGLMSKALRAVFDVYFKTHDEMDVTVHPMNFYSIKMLQRFNAKVVGFKSTSIYQNEPRMVLKILKKDFLNSCEPRYITNQRKTNISSHYERGRNV